MQVGREDTVRSQATYSLRPDQILFSVDSIGPGHQITPLWERPIKRIISYFLGFSVGIEYVCCHFMFTYTII